MGSSGFAGLLGMSGLHAAAKGCFSVIRRMCARAMLVGRHWHGEGRAGSNEPRLFLGRSSAAADTIIIGRFDIFLQ